MPRTLRLVGRSTGNWLRHSTRCGPRAIQHKPRSTPSPAVADDLIVSGGGSYAVATDELLAQADGLARLCSELAWARSMLLVIDANIQPSLLIALDAPLSTSRAEEHLNQGRHILLRCEAEARMLSLSLHASIELYGVGEAITETLARELSQRLGYALGLLSPLLVAVALPALAPAAAGILLGLMLQGKDLGVWLAENKAMLANPTTVALIRGAVMSSDDFLGGALHVPLPVVAALGDQGVGLTGLPTSAALLLLMGRPVGALAETPVQVTRTLEKPGSVSRTMEERAARIPQPELEANGEQIRIDRYSQPGQPDRFEVFVSGTVDFGVGGTEPWDMTSNVTGVAQLPAGSYRGLEQAMADAGVTADSPIVLTGYSQGALVASLIAGSGDYNVQAVVTFGAPAGQVVIPAEVPVLTIRHTDDIVPAIGGYDVNPHALVVERELFAGRQLPDDLVVPAHHFPYYQQTAGLVDNAESAKVRQALDSLAAFGDGATSVETTSYRAERVQCVTDRDPGR